MIEIKPTKPEVKVRKPNGEHLSAEGEKVERTAYWVRRLRDGDVVVVTSPNEATETVDKPITKKDK